MFGESFGFSGFFGSQVWLQGCCLQGVGFRVGFLFGISFMSKKSRGWAMWGWVWFVWYFFFLVFFWRVEVIKLNLDLGFFELIQVLLIRSVLGSLSLEWREVGGREEALLRLQVFGQFGLVVVWQFFLCFVCGFRGFFWKLG